MKDAFHKKIMAIDVKLSKKNHAKEASKSGAIKLFTTSDKFAQLLIVSEIKENNVSCYPFVFAFNFKVM